MRWRCENTPTRHLKITIQAICSHKPSENPGIPPALKKQKTTPSRKQTTLEAYLTPSKQAKMEEKMEEKMDSNDSSCTPKHETNITKSNSIFENGSLNSSLPQNFASSETRKLPMLPSGEIDPMMVDENFCQNFSSDGSSGPSYQAAQQPSSSDDRSQSYDGRTESLNMSNSAPSQPIINTNSTNNSSQSQADGILLNWLRSHKTKL